MRILTIVGGARVARTRIKTRTRCAATSSGWSCRSHDQGTLKEVFFNGDGCCISQAAASMLVEKFDGRHIDEVKKFTAKDMLELFGARLTPNRQKCCLLSWRVLQAAIYAPVQNAAAGLPIISAEENFMTAPQTPTFDPETVSPRFSDPGPHGP